jgi:hypothetical protein
MSEGQIPAYMHTPKFFPYLPWRATSSPRSLSLNKSTASSKAVLQSAI